MASTKGRKSVLIVDDEEALRTAVREALQDEGYDVVDSPSGPDALCKVTQEHFDAIISDVRMPQMSGFELLRILNKICNDTVVLLLTAVPDPDESLTEMAKNHGVYAYLTKPCSLDVVTGTLQRAFVERDSALSAHEDEALEEWHEVHMIV